MSILRIGLVVLGVALSLSRAEAKTMTLRKAEVIARQALQTKTLSGIVDAHSYFSSMDGNSEAEGWKVRVMTDTADRKIGRVFQVFPDGRVVHLHSDMRYWPPKSGDTLYMDFYKVGPKAGTISIRRNDERAWTQTRDGRGRFERERVFQ
jgi:hypothetical protein